MSSPLYPVPLDHGKPEIRLLEILDDEEHMKCKLSTVNLDHSPKFTALSYVWGDTEVTTNISVNDVQVPVTTNLASALKHVRTWWQYEFKSRPLSSFRIWVDAVCINQSDHKERNAQVKLMPRIYTSTELVLAWLGDVEDLNIKMAVVAVRVLGNAFRSAGWDPDELCDMTWLKSNSPLTQEPICDELWNSLDDLACLNYWKRVWILQENILASNLFYFTSNAMVEYNTLMNVCVTFTILSEMLIDRRVQKPFFVPDHIWIKLCPPKGTAFVQLRNIARMATSKVTFLEMGNKSDDAVMKNRLMLSEHGGTLQATNPKDHIYGLLGITSLEIDVDYSDHKSVRGVYTDYCRAVINVMRRVGRRRLVFLRDAGIGVFRDELGLASWAPNYPGRATGEPTLMFDGDYDLVSLATSLPQEVSLDGSVLSLSGIRLQVVTSVGGSPTLENLTEKGECVGWIHNYVQKKPAYPTHLPPLWTLFSVVMRTPRLEFDTTTFLLLQHFSNHVNLQVPKVAESSARSKLPRHIHTREEGGISMGVTIDGGNNPEMMIYLSPAAGAAKEVEKKMIEVQFRLIHSLKRNYNAKIFETADGHLGMGPKYMMEGDIVCVVDGYQDLVLLRRSGSGHYQYVGPCMALGLGKSSIKNKLKQGEVTVETINLI